jgi:cytochrome c peroxidase
VRTSIGSMALGLRNSLTNGYSSFIPPFSFEVKDGKTEPVGGHFWDGRANTLAEQALGPFLAVREMNNPDSATVVRKVAASSYATLNDAEIDDVVAIGARLEMVFGT